MDNGNKSYSNDVYIKSVVDSQRKLNEAYALSDNEKSQFIKIILDFIVKYEDALVSCKEENSKIIKYQNQINKYNSFNNADLTTAINNLNNCTNGLTNIDFQLQNAKTLGDSIILRLENVCIDKCNKENNKDIGKLKDCVKVCVKQSYVGEKIVDKELSNIILNYNI